MGLSTKQVSNDHLLDWRQTLLEAGTVELTKPPTTKRHQQNQQQQLSEPLKCPRCGSTNTKFCYYNNYNKSQPRHFCKACKRHWTKGGTLRNVPIGGGRKNKRLKTANAATSTTTATANTSPIGGDSSGRNYVNLAPVLSLPQDHQSLQFSFSSSSPFDTIPNSFLSSNLPLNNAYNYTGEIDHLESSTITTVTPTTTSLGIFSHSWQGQATNTSSINDDMPNYWNWNDIDPLVSADLNVSWDDIEIKP